MIGVTVVIQACAQIALGRFRDAVPIERRPHHSIFWILYVVAAVLVLILNHIVQVVVWAVLYASWGELGTFGSAIYFSLANYTTVGTSNLTLSAPHRIVGAVESAAGMLMFGWSTALLVQVVSRADGQDRA